MKPTRRPMFLDPERYRRRRLMDAARMLPVLGAFLFFLPVLWLPAGASHRTAMDGIYLFTVWAALIVLARAFAPSLASTDPGAAPAADPTDKAEAPGGDGGMA